MRKHLVLRRRGCKHVVKRVLLRLGASLDPCMCHQHCTQAVSKRHVKPIPCGTLTGVRHGVGARPVVPCFAGVRDVFGVRGAVGVAALSLRWRTGVRLQAQPR